MASVDERSEVAGVSEGETVAVAEEEAPVNGEEDAAPEEAAVDVCSVGFCLAAEEEAAAEEAAADLSSTGFCLASEEETTDVLPRPALFLGDCRLRFFGKGSSRCTRYPWLPRLVWLPWFSVLSEGDGLYMYL